MDAVVLHPDLEVLSSLVGRMRARGIDTIHGTAAAALLERALKADPTVLVIPERPASAQVRAEVEMLRCELPGIAEVVVTNVSHGNLDEVVNHVVESVTSTMALLTKASEPNLAVANELRGDLRQLAIPDLLQLLALGRKTGVLSISTASAAGEIRMSDGEVVDATFRRAEGMKALIRMLSERDGGFQFEPDSSPALRRIREPFQAILMDGTRQADEARRARAAIIGDIAVPFALQVVQAQVPPTATVLRRDLLQLLTKPRALDDLLDDLPQPDLDILTELQQLDAEGLLRRVALGDFRPSLAGPEGLVVLRGLVRRLRPLGFRGGARMVLVGSDVAIRLARTAAVRIAEAVPAAEFGGELAGERTIELTASLHLGESMVLELLTVVDDPSLVPVFPMIACGTLAVVALSRLSYPLERMIDQLELALLDLRSLATHAERPSLDLGSPEDLAALLRAGVEWLGAS